MMKTALAFLALLWAALSAAPAGAQTAPLNDTGIVLCGNANEANNLDCASNYVYQDGHYGRAAMDAVGVLYKVGASSSLGFDFTKIANNGAALPPGATLGSAATDWACTRDNVTGLTWEVKVNDPTHLRHTGHTYSWYDTDGTRNGGDNGLANAGTCAGGSGCDTSKFVADVNATQLCGYTDWRMPDKDELLTLVDQSKQNSGQPTIDSDYFPHTQADWYRSSTSFASHPSMAWGTSFSTGRVTAPSGGKTLPLYIRLVRKGP